MSGFSAGICLLTKRSHLHDCPTGDDEYGYFCGSFRLLIFRLRSSEPFGYLALIAHMEQMMSMMRGANIYVERTFWRSDSLHPNGKSCFLFGSSDPSGQSSLQCETCLSCQYFKHERQYGSHSQSTLLFCVTILMENFNT